MKSWRTTLAGVLGAIGIYVLGLDWEFAQILGSILNGASLLLIGTMARDNSVSSETAGAE